MIILKACPFPKNKKRKLLRFVKKFIKKENIRDVFDSITIDWTPAKTSNTYGGYYGGLVSLYRDKKAYINLTVFYEINNLNDMRQILWAVYHELIHCRQMFTGEIIVSQDANSLVYNQRVYEKLDFRAKVFLDIYDKNPQEATEYHIKKIPWEGECYYKSDIYTGIKSFNHKILQI